MLPLGHARYGEMQMALVKSFNFRNITQEGVEFLADGVGADEIDWGLISDYEDGSGAPLPPEVEALKLEASQLLLEWWTTATCREPYKPCCKPPSLTGARR